MGIETVSVVGSGEWPQFFLIFPAQTAGVIKLPFFVNFLGIFLLIVHFLAWQLKDPCTTFGRMWSV